MVFSREGVLDNLNDGSRASVLKTRIAKRRQLVEVRGSHRLINGDPNIAGVCTEAGKRRVNGVGPRIRNQ